jgi:hypothetical protein
MIGSGPDSLPQKVARLGETPVGQQILALTQADRIVDRPVSCLDSSLELLSQHRRLGAATNASVALRPPIAAEPSSMGENQ